MQNYNDLLCKKLQLQHMLSNLKHQYAFQLGVGAIFQSNILQLISQYKKKIKFYDYQLSQNAQASQMKAIRICDYF
eukprot:EST46498.1 Hypothetical protein SS50377_13579 [Spironucleus salmonicida]